MMEAVAQLTKGLEVLANLPEGTARQQHELDLRLAIGPALIATQGWAAEATGKTYERAGELCEELDQRQHLGAVLFGQFTYRNLRGEFRLAHETAAAVLRIGEARNDAVLIYLGHHLLGYNYILLGEFTLARAELEQKLLALSDPAVRSDATGGVDQLVATLVHLAQPLAQLGYLDQARARRDAASCVRQVLQLTMVPGDDGGEPPLSIAAVAARCLDRLQLLKIEFDDDLQLLRQSRPSEAGRQVVEPGAVFLLEVEQCRHRRRPALGPRRGAPRRRRGRRVVVPAQPGPASRLALGWGHWPGAEARSGHVLTPAGIVTVTFAN